VQRRRIVDAVAEISDNVTASFERTNDALLLLWIDTTEEIEALDGGA
jgi:hypothetical protein